MKNILVLAGIICALSILSMPVQEKLWIVDCNFSWEENPEKNVRRSISFYHSYHKEITVREKEKERIMKVNPSPVRVSAKLGKRCILNHPENTRIDKGVLKSNLILDAKKHPPSCSDINAKVTCRARLLRKDYEDNCKDWCNKNKPECVKCSTLKGCGIGYQAINKWSDRGKNWYACKKLKSRDEETENNRKACQAYCANYKPRCVKCSTLKNCGRGLKNMKSWTGYGKNYHACEKR